MNLNAYMGKKKRLCHLDMSFHQCHRGWLVAVVHLIASAEMPVGTFSFGTLGLSGIVVVCNIDAN